MYTFNRLWKRIPFLGVGFLNISKRGISLSLGKYGTHFTFGMGGSRLTVGIPHTGLYRSYVFSSRSVRGFSRTERKILRKLTDQNHMRELLEFWSNNPSLAP